MAKNGFIFFQIDTDILQDSRIRRLKRQERGRDKFLVYFSVLKNIYSEKGYYMEASEDRELDIAEDWGLEESFVHDTIEECCRIGLFDTELYHKGYITSAAIQERYAEMCKKTKRIYTIDESLNLSKTSEEIGKNSEERAKNSEEIGKNSEDLRLSKDKLNKKESTLKSAKEKAAAVAATRSQKSPTDPIVEDEKEGCDNSGGTRTEDDAQGGTRDAPPISPAQKKAEAQAALKRREQEFYNSLVPYVAKYGKEMIREFYDYWSEPNRSGTKMKYELQQTFEISRRLVTWAGREDKYKQQPPTIRNNGRTVTATKQRNAKFADFGETMAAIEAGINAGITERGISAVGK